MPDYSNAKIYTIRNYKNPSLIYVGSTIQPLSYRWGCHKYKSLNKHNLLYKTINNEWADWYIELYELFPCNCKEELLKKEGEIIRLIGSLNMRISGRKSGEYYKDNKDKIIKYQKEYNKDNKDKILIYKKEYIEKNRNKIKEYYKQYRENKKENLKINILSYV